METDTYVWDMQAKPISNIHGAYSMSIVDFHYFFFCEQSDPHEEAGRFD